MEPLNALTIDVEDYFQVSAFEGQVERSAWGRYESRVEHNTLRLVELLRKHDVVATFFVLGWIAERYPDLVRAIQDGGHEVASHGYWHRLIYDQTPDEFRDDLRRSKQVLESILCQPVVSYRAPSFSITPRSRWALEILVEEGFEIDSSIYPVRHDRYGMPGAPCRPHMISTQSGQLWEVPPAVFQWGPCRLPVAGGGYFRLYPLAMTTRCLRRLNRTEGRPFVFYLHPWEIDPDQPRIGGLPLRSRLRHYVNLHSTERKLQALLREFRFGRLQDLVSSVA